MPILEKIFYSDEKLISGCIAGDRRLWDIFVERFSKLIYWAILKALAKTEYIQRQDLVSEIYQEVFEKILEKNILLKLREEKSLKTFICVIAGHTAMDKIKLLRRRDHNEISMHEIMTEDESGASVGLESMLLDKTHPSPLSSDTLFQDEILKVVNDLDDNEKYALVARYSHGHSQKEIALTLGLPLGSVTSLISRAKDKVLSEAKKKGLSFES